MRIKSIDIDRSQQMLLPNIIAGGSEKIWGADFEDKNISSLMWWIGICTYGELAARQRSFFARVFGKRASEPDVMERLLKKKGLKFTPEPVAEDKFQTLHFIGQMALNFEETTSGVIACPDEVITLIGAARCLSRLR
jgi:hypothetical protein